MGRNSSNTSGWPDNLKSCQIFRETPAPDIIFWIPPFVFYEVAIQVATWSNSVCRVHIDTQPQDKSYSGVACGVRHFVGWAAILWFLGIFLVMVVFPNGLILKLAPFVITLLPQVNLFCTCVCCCQRSVMLRKRVANLATAQGYQNPCYFTEIVCGIQTYGSALVHLHVFSIFAILA